MLPKSLQLLLRLQVGAFIRKQRMNLREPRKAIAMVALYGMPLGFFVLFIVAHLIVPSEEFSFLAGARKEIAFALGCFLLIPMASAIYEMPFIYTPPEVQFLFPAPFTQRQLAAYKMVILAVPALPVAVFFSLAYAGASRGWPAAFLSLSLFMWFSTAATCLAALLFRMPWIRLVMYAGLIGLAGIGMRDALNAVPSFRQEFSFSGIGTSLTARIVSWPTRPFANMMTLSVTSSGWWFSFAIAGAAVVATTGLTLALIGNFQEQLFAASRRREERLARMRSGKLFSGSWAAPARLRLRMLPRLGGLGPMLYSGLSTAARSKGYVFTLIGLLCIFTVFGLAARNEWIGTSAKGVRSIGASISVQVMIFSLMWMRYDLRGRFALLDYFKTLPVHPGSFAAGAVLASALAAFGVQCAPMLAYALGNGAPVFPLWFLLFLLPANTLWFAIDNAVFLRAPSAPRVAGSPDPGQMGRELLSLLIKVLAVGVIALLCAAVYGLMWVVVESNIAAWVMVWLTSGACAAGACLLTGVAFRDLDLGRDRL